VIDFLIAAAAAGQAPPHPYKIDQAVVIADVLQVGVPKGLSCVNTAESICVIGIPDVAKLKIRKVLYGKIAKGVVAVLSGAPVNIQTGRRTLLMQGGEGQWLVTAVTQPRRPCSDVLKVYPENSADPVFRRVGDQYCLTARH
jgi:hypothetical protein